MFFVAVTYIAGLLMGLWWPLPTGVAWLLATACVGWSIIRLWRAQWIGGPTARTGAALLAAVTLVGLWQGGRLVTQDRRAEQALQPWEPGERVRIEGRVAEEPRIGRDWLEIVLQRPEVTSLRVHGTRATVPTRAAVKIKETAFAKLMNEPTRLPLPGQLIRIWGRFDPVEPARNPHPFNFNRYNRSRAIGLRCFIKKPADIELAEAPEGARARLYRGSRRVRA